VFFWMYRGRVFCGALPPNKLPSRQCKKIMKYGEEE
jgi:hypothetical protein